MLQKYLNIKTAFFILLLLFIGGCCWYYLKEIGPDGEYCYIVENIFGSLVSIALVGVLYHFFVAEENSKIVQKKIVDALLARLHCQTLLSV